MDPSGRPRRRPAHAAAEPPQRHGVAACLAAVLALLAAVAGWPEEPREPVTIVARLPLTLSLPEARVPGSPADEQLRMERVSPGAPAAGPKELVERALQSRDLPLRTEAYRLLRHCAFVLAAGSVAPLASPPPWMPRDRVRLAEQAWQALAGRCDSLRGLPNHEALQGQLDPVPRFTANGSSPADAEAQWLAGTFRQHGSMALLWAGDALAAYVEERTGEPEGDRFDTLDPEAIEIARCRFGEDCSAGSDAAQVLCITLGACEGDVPQRVLASLGSRAARERVTRQAGALIEALEKGDLKRYAIGGQVAGDASFE
jgi:hypothetical protein